MPNQEGYYPEHAFEAETIRSAYELFKRFVSGQVPEERRSSLAIDGNRIHLDEAHEFFESYRVDAESAELAVTYKVNSFLFSYDGISTRVEVGLPLETETTKVIQVFDQAARLASDEQLVFLGHGRDPSWTKLARHLASQHDIQVRTYENSIRAGVTAIELLEQLAGEVDFAVLVHTQDRLTKEDGIQPSANVVHETGFFQGALGRHRTVVLRERGCPQFHNIAGLHEVTFEPENIQDAFRHVMALIRNSRPAQS